MATTGYTQRYPSATVVDHSILAESLELPFSKVTLKNRFLKAALTERLATWDQLDVAKRGLPNDELFRLYSVWGKAGFGVIATGNILVTPFQAEAAGNMIIYKPFETPERIAAFQKLSASIKAHGSLAYAQINHAGRQAPEYMSMHPVSASDIQLEPRYGMSFAKPTPLTKGGIKEVVDQFAYAAEFLYRTGFDGVQVHCAHGYLLAQFLSSTTNKRTDEYGGPLQNRARIVYEVIEEIRRRVPDKKFSIAIKINSVEFQEGGFQPEECAEVCAHLEALGVDFVELSGGTYEDWKVMTDKRESTKKREAFFTEFASVIRPSLKTSKVYVTGGFRTAAAMVQVIQSGEADGIGLGRPISEEPDLPSKLISGEVSSALRPLLDPDDFGLAVMITGTQMRQIGSGIRPFSTINQNEINDFLGALQEYMAHAVELGKQGIIITGYPELGGVPLGI